MRKICWKWARETAGSNWPKSPETWKSIFLDSSMIFLWRVTYELHVLSRPNYIACTYVRTYMYLLGMGYDTTRTGGRERITLLVAWSHESTVRLPAVRRRISGWSRSHLLVRIFIAQRPPQWWRNIGKKKIEKIIVEGENKKRIKNETGSSCIRIESLAAYLDDRDRLINFKIEQLRVLPVDYFGA